MLTIFFLASGLGLVYFSAGAFLKKSFFQFSINFWSSKKYSTLKTKILGLIFFSLGLILTLVGLGSGLVDFEERQILNKIAAEAKLLNIPPYEYEKIKSAFVFMPKGSSVSDYLKEDEIARKEGFKDGLDYILAKYRAEKEGISFEQYKQKIKEERAKKEEERIAKESKLKQEALERKQAEDSRKEVQNAYSLIPIGVFYTDRGQVSQAVYRAACINAYTDRKFIVTELGVFWTHSPEGKLANNLGKAAISNTKIWWSEESGKCYGSYTISGMVDGSNYSLSFSGKVQGFNNDGAGNISGTISRF